MSVSEINKMIDACDCKDSLKNKFKFFAEKGADKKLFGPSFNSKVSLNQYANWFAFIFNCWYYVFTGMWKKGVALLILAVCASLVGGEISPRLGQVGALITACICLMSANFDRYRKIVLKEDFWW